MLTPGPHESKAKAIAPRTSLAAEVGSIKMDLVYDIKKEQLLLPAMCLCLEITARGHLELARGVSLAVSSQFARPTLRRF